MNKQIKNTQFLNLPKKVIVCNNFSLRPSAPFLNYLRPHPLYFQLKAQVAYSIYLYFDWRSHNKEASKKLFRVNYLIKFWSNKTVSC